jgi:hypothetical protein
MEYCRDRSKSLQGDLGLALGCREIEQGVLDFGRELVGKAKGDRAVSFCGRGRRVPAWTCSMPRLPLTDEAIGREMLCEPTMLTGHVLRLEPILRTMVKLKKTLDSSPLPRNETCPLFPPQSDVRRGQAANLRRTKEKGRDSEKGRP